MVLVKFTNLQVGPGSVLMSPLGPETPETRLEGTPVPERTPKAIFSEAASDRVGQKVCLLFQI